MMKTIDRCTVCGEDIPVGEAEFDLEGGRIGLPYHKVCLSMPESLKARIELCPECGHNKGRHMEVDFDETTYKISNARWAVCSCGCAHYMSDT